MKNKNAFTLVELIAVVSILGLIALIVYPTIASVIKDARENSYQDQVTVIEKAAKSWSIDNASKLSTDGKSYNLKMSELLNGGYISSEDVKDPRNSSKTLSGYVEIKYDSEYKQFMYEYID